MRRLNIFAVIVFAGLVIWITLFQPEAVSRIQSGAMVVFEPFMKASTRLESGVETAGTEALSPVQMRSMLSDLERERDRLKLEVIQLDEIVRENNELRRALQYVEKAPLAVVAARVINRKPSNWYNTMVIDKGSNHGVQVDSPVIVPVGEAAGLVGKVSEVISENSSLVLLLTDEMCQVSAKLENSQEQGILGGQRGALRTMPNLRLRYLSKEAEAGTGRKVVSSGAGGLFPPDLLLGEVLSLEIGAIDAEATVKPGVNFEELIDIFVVLPAVEEEEIDDPEPVALDLPPGETVEP
ncbi:MAG: rod shape-determining protein MreC [Verrucomicrobiales bacterium]|nr:rod shape-determining protein MreC [Verrucomicrobiales bacterium]